jgi:hypothetical protein
VTDIKILAEEAKQVTMGKKNRPGTVVAYQRRFFAKVWHTAGYNSQFTGPAMSCLSGKAVSMAAARTQVTRSQPVFQQGGSFFQEARAMSLQICWLIITGHDLTDLFIPERLIAGKPFEQRHKIKLQEIKL